MNEIQIVGRKVFEVTMQKAQLLVEQGTDPLAICAGLTAVVSELGLHSVGPTATARIFQEAAKSLLDSVLDS